MTGGQRIDYSGSAKAEIQKQQLRRAAHTPIRQNLMTMLQSLAGSGVITPDEGLGIIQEALDSLKADAAKSARNG